MIQVILQKRWESWRWQAQWMVISIWQWPVESSYWSWSLTTMRSCWRTQRWPFYDCSAFEAIWKRREHFQDGVKRDVTLGQVRGTTIMSRIKCVIASMKTEDAIWNEKGEQETDLVEKYNEFGFDMHCLFMWFIVYQFPKRTWDSDFLFLAKPYGL